MTDIPHPSRPKELIAGRGGPLAPLGSFGLRSVESSMKYIHETQLKTVSYLIGI